MMSAEKDAGRSGGQADLAGQTVVVLGGSSGIGFETARQVRAAGAEVVLTGRNAERVEAAGSAVSARSTSAFDAHDPEALKRFFATLDGPIDHVMVTAGGPHYGLVSEMSLEEARSAVSDRILLALSVGHLATGRLTHGTLVFISGSGRGRPQPGSAIESAVDAAMPALTASLAVELAPVRVNLIGAGFVDTPLSARVLGDGLDGRRAGTGGDAPDPSRR